MEKKFIINGNEIKVENFKHTAEEVSFTLNGKSYSYSLMTRKGRTLVLDDGERFKGAVSSLNKDSESMIVVRGHEGMISEAGKKKKKAASQAGSLTSPMPGKIFKIIKESGSEVKKGETILILEAMKMEHSIRADKDGKVKNIFFKLGELVQGGVTLAEVE